MTVDLSPLPSRHLAETQKRLTDLTPMSPVPGCKKLELRLRVPQTSSGVGSPKLVSNRNQNRDIITSFESEPVKHGIDRISRTSYHLDDLCEADMLRPWQMPPNGDPHRIESALKVSKIKGGITALATSLPSRKKRRMTQLPKLDPRVAVCPLVVYQDKFSQADSIRDLLTASGEHAVLDVNSFNT